MKRIIITAAAIGLLAAGCGGEVVKAASAAPRSVPASSAPPADGGSYDNPSDIIAKAGDALPCSDAVAETPTGALAQSSCADGDVVVRTYADHSGVDDQIRLHSLGGGMLLTGANWTLNASPAQLKAAHTRLGGHIVTIACEELCG
jgi:hypothetical protein